MMRTQYSPNIFTRGRTQRNDPWIDRGASSEKTAKTISDLVKDNITGVDAQRRSATGKPIHLILLGLRVCLVTEH